LYWFPIKYSHYHKQPLESNICLVLTLSFHKPAEFSVQRICLRDRMRKISKIPILFYDSYTSYFFLTSVLPETKSALSQETLWCFLQRKSLLLLIENQFFSSCTRDIYQGFCQNWQLALSDKIWNSLYTTSRKWPGHKS
jgi:hypothetical protein